MKITQALILGFLFAASFALGVFVGPELTSQISNFNSPLVPEKEKPVEHPYLAYSIPALQGKTYEPVSIQILEPIATESAFTSSLFSAQFGERSMIGQINLPTVVTTKTPIILMIRGYVPAESYQTGVGTKNAAAVFAKNGYITIAPDFFGMAGSDDELADVWAARFEKPVLMAQLLQSLPSFDQGQHKVGIWAHSNGGQIALTTLEISQQPIPTTLWAPVTAPFPYSVLYYSDEEADEGRAVRLWINQLESEYVLRQFSLRQYVTALTGPLQIHHGQLDEAAPKIWSDEFAELLTANNVQHTYYEYPAADHNLQPNWNLAVQRDLEFFAENLD
ncbi:MAG: prolyl oligopeptidase family serine peptidase [Candidatus Pacebacteria bacterium]|nr:prolyl oligopeptidase family serine peptidase [Candidatus Paceibacterota bacterium]